jgi:hypothetical protein
MRKNINCLFSLSVTLVSNYKVFILLLLMTCSCTLKQGKKLYITDKQGEIQQFNIKLSEKERNNLNGEKIFFSKLSYFRADGSIENQPVNSIIVLNDKVLDISTKEPLKHFPFTILIQSLSKSDSGIAVNLVTNNFIRKAFIRKDHSSLIALTVKQSSAENKNQVVKMIFFK